MITWGFMGAASDAGSTYAIVLVCPDDRIMYAGLASRLRMAGLQTVNAVVWGRLLLDATSCLVTVEDECFTEIHTGSSRLTAAEPQRLTPLWLTLATSGRVVLALVPPGTLPQFEADPNSDEVEVWTEKLDALATARGILAGFATVIDKPAPAAGPVVARTET